MNELDNTDTLSTASPSEAEAATMIPSESEAKAASAAAGGASVAEINLSRAAGRRSDPTDNITYTDLYRRWEQGNWKAYGLDFSKDRDGWQALTEMQRRSARWLYSMFFYGEDSVADNLSPYIDAAPTEEQAYFLTTQQVDEARHAVFFHRFFQEVLEQDGDLAETLQATQPYLNWGYRKVFSRLDRMADELRQDRSLPKFAQAITLYHLVVEATMAQPGQHMIQDFFLREAKLPGFSEGMDNVAADEQRHIGFGVKTLSELFRQSDECKQAVTEILAEVLPHALAVLIPPDWDQEYISCYGTTLEDVFAAANRSIDAKWKAAGYPLQEMPAHVYPFGDLAADERARVQIKLLKTGMVGPPQAYPPTDPASQALVFETVAHVAEPQAVKDGFIVQWDFNDADPWYLQVRDDKVLASDGTAVAPDLELKIDYTDWLLLTRGANPLRMMLEGRLKAQGGIAELRQLARLLPDRSHGSQRGLTHSLLDKL